MNIQRKYSLPNCTLVLEGLTNSGNPNALAELRPQLAILVNAECYLSGLKEPISGGREFFESLVTAASGYAQEFLSRVRHPEAHNSESGLVYFQRVDKHLHRLVVRQDSEHQGNTNSATTGVQVDLTTVQLFDLVEAIDQFFADTQTLPDIALQLAPVSRRDAGNGSVVLKQVVPAGVGVSSLAVAALAFALIPPPPVKPPEEPKAQDNTTQNATAASPITAATPTPNATATPEITPTPTPTATLTPQATATPTPNQTSGVAAELETLLKNAPEITDNSQLYALNRQLYNQIFQAQGGKSPSSSEDLVFRVGVASDGAIIGYKGVSKTANDAVEKTPLPKLLYNPATRNNAGSEPIAQFKVVFTKQGELQVSPWKGYSSKAKDVLTPKIDDAKTLSELSQKLEQEIKSKWQGNLSYNRDLLYRVALTKDGAIADYEPLNQVAFDYAKDTPLPQLFQASNQANAASKTTQEPLAQYRVVFKPNGVLEITPWQGYR